MLLLFQVTKDSNSSDTGNLYDGLHLFGAIDIICAPIFILMSILFFKFFFEKYKDYPYYKYLMPAFFIRFLSPLVNGLLIEYYYGYGDMKGYYYGQVTLVDGFLADPYTLIRDYLTLSNEELAQLREVYGDIYSLLSKTPSAYIAQMAAILSPLGFNRFLTCGWVFSILSFLGSWRLYKFFIVQFPHMYKEFAWAVLFLPSCFFWGSGMYKDTVSYAFLGFLSYAFYQVFILNENKFKGLLTIFVSTFFILNSKPYVFLAFAPTALLWVLILQTNKIKDKILKRGTIIFAFSSLAVGLYFMMELVSSSGREDIARFSAEKIIEEIKEQQYWANEIGGGSNFSLGDFDPTPLGIAKIVPSAISASLFRPYIWEVKNPLMIFTSVESLIFLAFTFYLLVRIRPNELLRIITSQPILILCLLFSLIFAAAVGISTLNFGSLARYKIPCLPFYFSFLLIIYDQGIKNKKIKSD